MGVIDTRADRKFPPDRAHASRGATFRRRTAIWIATLASGLAGTPARAETLRIGAELTLTSPRLIRMQRGANIVSSDESEATLARLQSALTARCAAGACTVTNGTTRYGSPKFRITYADGFWFEMTTDPSVIEITTKPSTLQELAAQRDRLQRDVFELARDTEGLRPHREIGGGHLNLGWRGTFDRDPRLFRNFIVDLLNHPELFSGILGDHAHNAKPSHALTQTQRQALAAVLRRFDHRQNFEASAFARAIVQEVYEGWSSPEVAAAKRVFNQAKLRRITSGDDLRSLASDPRFSADSRAILRALSRELDGDSPPGNLLERLERDLWFRSKRMAVNLITLASRAAEDSAKRIELRGVRPQRGVDELLTQGALFETRLAYLAGLKENIPLRLPGYMRKGERLAAFGAWLAEMRAPPGRFESLVREASLLYRDVRDFMPRCLWSLLGG